VLALVVALPLLTFIGDITGLMGGGVMAVVNRQLGIGTYSPRLDQYGNSCRGIAACEAMASRLGLHVFDCLNVGSSYLTAVL